MTSRLRQTLTHNLGIKISSIILALFIYAYVFSREEHESVFPVTVTLAGLPDDLTYQGEVPERVRVRIRARGIDLVKLRAQPPRAVIELKEASPGQLQRPVTTADVRIPNGNLAQVRSIVDQPVLRLHIEPLIRRRVPVLATVAGTPAEGAVLSGVIDVDPDSVEVRGPASLLEAIETLRTEEIDLDGRSSTVEESALIRVPDDLWVAVDEVRVEVPIELVERQVLGPVPVGLPPALGLAWTTQPESVRVRVQGPPSLLEALAPGEIEVRALPRQPIEGEQDSVVVEVKPDPALDARLSFLGCEPSRVSLIRRTR